MRRSKYFLVFITLIILLGLINSAFSKNNSNIDSVTIQRLGDLCKIWGVIKYFHPDIAYGKIDWDKVLIETIPKIRSAKNRDEYVNAIQYLLNKLNDPVTRIQSKGAEDVVEYDFDLTEPQPYYRWLEDSVVIVIATDYSQFINTEESIGKFNKMLSDLSKAKAIIFDFRRLTKKDADSETSISKHSFSFVINRIIPLLINSNLRLPSHRTRYHCGNEWQRGSRHIYYSGFITQNHEILIPKSDTIQIKPLCFIINEHTGAVLDRLIALKKSGKAFIIAEGSVSGKSLYQTYTIQLSDSLEVTIRTSELVHIDGTSGFQIDSTVPISNDTSFSTNSAIKVALRIVSNYKTKQKEYSQKAPITFSTFKEKAYQEMVFPSYEYRLLALFRYWNAINYFFPYKNLIGYNWENTLYEFIPNLDAINDSLEYHLAIAELRTRIHDAHAYMISNVLREYWGNYSPPIKTEFIEGKTIITKILNDSIAKVNDLQIGDIIVKIDNEDIEKVRSRFSSYLASSNTQSLQRQVNSYILRGKQNSTVSFSIQCKNSIQKIKLNREMSWWEVYQSEKEGPIWEVMQEGCGYVDLDRLMPSQVDSAFDALKSTEAIIFDMRGYPNGTAWSIAPRLTDVPVKAAKFYLPIVTNPDTLSNTFEYFYSVFETSEKWLYKGKIIVLVNEYTQSQAEYTCMILQACANTTIIGSGTAGSDGNITNVILPGDIVVGFTGLGVLYPDGRQTQRIGIIPDIVVNPTINGIREGRDEMLEKAVEFYKSLE